MRSNSVAYLEPVTKKKVLKIDSECQICKTFFFFVIDAATKSLKSLSLQNISSIVPIIRPEPIPINPNIASKSWGSYH
jgi:hypothetical protein